MFHSDLELLLTGRLLSPKGYAVVFVTGLVIGLVTGWLAA